MSYFSFLNFSFVNPRVVFVFFYVGIVNLDYAYFHTEKPKTVHVTTAVTNTSPMTIKVVVF